MFSEEIQPRVWFAIPSRRVYQNIEDKAPDYDYIEPDSPKNGPPKIKMLRAQSNNNNYNYNSYNQAKVSQPTKKPAVSTPIIRPEPPNQNKFVINSAVQLVPWEQENGKEYDYYTDFEEDNENIEIPNTKTNTKNQGKYNSKKASPKGKMDAIKGKSITAIKKLPAKAVKGQQNLKGTQKLGKDYFDYDYEAYQDYSPDSIKVPLKGKQHNTPKQKPIPNNNVFPEMTGKVNQSFAVDILFNDLTTKENNNKKNDVKKTDLTTESFPGKQHFSEIDSGSNNDVNIESTKKNSIGLKDGEKHGDISTNDEHNKDDINRPDSLRDPIEGKQNTPNGKSSPSSFVDLDQAGKEMQSLKDKERNKEITTHDHNPSNIGKETDSIKDNTQEKLNIGREKKELFSLENPEQSHKEKQGDTGKKEHPGGDASAGKEDSNSINYTNIGKTMEGKEDSKGSKENDKLTHNDEQNQNAITKPEISNGEIGSNKEFRPSSNTGQENFVKKVENEDPIKNGNAIFNSPHNSKQEGKEKQDKTDYENDRDFTANDDHHEENTSAELKYKKDHLLGKVDSNEPESHPSKSTSPIDGHTVEQNLKDEKDSETEIFHNNIVKDANQEAYNEEKESKNVNYEPNNLGSNFENENHESPFGKSDGQNGEIDSKKENNGFQSDDQENFNHSDYEDYQAEKTSEDEDKHTPKRPKKGGQKGKFESTTVRTHWKINDESQNDDFLNSKKETTSWKNEKWPHNESEQGDIITNGPKEGWTNENSHSEEGNPTLTANNWPEKDGPDESNREDETDGNEINTKLPLKEKPTGKFISLEGQITSKNKSGLDFGSMGSYESINDSKNGMTKGKFISKKGKPNSGIDSWSEGDSQSDSQNADKSGVDDINATEPKKIGEKGKFGPKQGKIALENEDVSDDEADGNGLFSNQPKKGWQKGKHISKKGMPNMAFDNQSEENTQADSQSAEESDVDKVNWKGEKKAEKKGKYGAKTGKTPWKDMDVPDNGSNGSEFFTNTPKKGWSKGKHISKKGMPNMAFDNRSEENTQADSQSAEESDIDEVNWKGLKKVGKKGKYGAKKGKISWKDMDESDDGSKGSDMFTNIPKKGWSKGKYISKEEMTNLAFDNWSGENTQADSQSAEESDVDEVNWKGTKKAEKKGKYGAKKGKTSWKDIDVQNNGSNGSDFFTNIPKKGWSKGKHISKKGMPNLAFDNRSEENTQADSQSSEESVVDEVNWKGLKKAGKKGKYGAKKGKKACKDMDESDDGSEGSDMFTKRPKKGWSKGKYISKEGMPNLSFDNWSEENTQADLHSAEESDVDEVNWKGEKKVGKKGKYGAKKGKTAWKNMDESDDGSKGSDMFTNRPKKGWLKGKYISNKGNSKWYNNWAEEDHLAEQNEADIDDEDVEQLDQKMKREKYDSFKLKTDWKNDHKLDNESEEADVVVKGQKKGWSNGKFKLSKEQLIKTNNYLSEEDGNLEFQSKDKTKENYEFSKGKNFSENNRPTWKSDNNNVKIGNEDISMGHDYKTTKSKGKKPTINNSDRYQWSQTDDEIQSNKNKISGPTMQHKHSSIIGKHSGKTGPKNVHPNTHNEKNSKAQVQNTAKFLPDKSPNSEIKETKININLNFFLKEEHSTKPPFQGIFDTKLFPIRNLYQETFPTLRFPTYQSQQKSGSQNKSPYYHFSNKNKKDMKNKLNNHQPHYSHYKEIAIPWGSFLSNDISKVNSEYGTNANSKFIKRHVNPRHNHPQKNTVEDYSSNGKDKTPKSFLPNAWVPELSGIYGDDDKSDQIPTHSVDFYSYINQLDKSIPTDESDNKDLPPPWNLIHPQWMLQNKIKPDDSEIFSSNKMTAKKGQINLQSNDNISFQTNGGIQDDQESTENELFQQKLIEHDSEEPTPNSQFGSEKNKIFDKKYQIQFGIFTSGQPLPHPWGINTKEGQDIYDNQIKENHPSHWGFFSENSLGKRSFQVKDKPEPDEEVDSEEFIGPNYENKANEEVVDDEEDDDIEHPNNYEFEENELEFDEDQSFPKSGQHQDEESGNPEAAVQKRGFTDFINKFWGQFGRMRPSRRF